MDVVLLIFLLTAAVLSVWYLVAKESFTNTFLGKPETRNPVHAPSVSAEVVKVQTHNRAGGQHEHVGYINEPIQQVVAKPPKHEIIKTDYYPSSYGEPWPRWTCRCGASDYVPTTVYSGLQTAQAKARKAGAAHVYNATEADRRLEESNGKFAF